MGCDISKLLASVRGYEEAEPPETPKVYSWDKRQKVNTQDLIVDGKKSEFISRLPGVVNGQQFIIQNCENCDIYVFDHCATVTIDDCTDCRIFIGAVKTSIFVRDCKKCTVAATCQQFRTRDCQKLDAFLCCVTQPIIEATTGTKFGCFLFNYSQLKNHMENAGLSIFNNNWSNIHDFTPVSGENNYSILPKTSLGMFLKYPEESQLQSIEISMEPDASVVPFTCGIHRRPDGLACLIVVFSSNRQQTVADRIVASLQDSVLVQTALVNLSDTQAIRIFSSDKYNSKVIQGKVIMVEVIVESFELCRERVLQAVGDDVMNVHISSSIEEAAKELDNFNNLVEMQMAV